MYLPQSFSEFAYSEGRPREPAPLIFARVGITWRRLDAASAGIVRKLSDPSNINNFLCAFGSERSAKLKAKTKVAVGEFPRT